MNILVTGANGQLGSEMRLVSKASKADRYLFADIVDLPGVETMKLDITDLRAIRKVVSDNEIGCIVNCAAYTNVDKAEDDRETAELLNATAAGYLATAMAEVGGFLVHISTDYVFGGNQNNTPCKEDQTTNPTGVYGETKLHGECAVKSAGCEYMILRTAWLYSEFGHNFVKTMLELTASKPSLKVVFDQAGTPTYALDLASLIFDVVENRKYVGHTGTYHFSNEGVCSWYDFTKMIANLSGNSSCDVQPCHSSEFPSKVVRPSYSVLDKTLVKETFGVRIPYWTDSLAKCLENLKKQ